MLSPISLAHEIANLPYPTSKRPYCRLGIRRWLTSPATRVEALQNRLCLVQSVLVFLFFLRLPTSYIYTGLALTERTWSTTPSTIFSYLVPSTQLPRNFPKLLFLNSIAWVSTSNTVSSISCNPCSPDSVVCNLANTSGNGTILSLKKHTAKVLSFGVSLSSNFFPHSFFSVFSLIVMFSIHLLGVLSLKIWRIGCPALTKRRDRGCDRVYQRLTSNFLLDPPFYNDGKGESFKSMIDLHSSTPLLYIITPFS